MRATFEVTLYGEINKDGSKEDVIEYINKMIVFVKNDYMKQNAQHTSLNIISDSNDREGK